MEVADLDFDSVYLMQLRLPLESTSISVGFPKQWHWRNKTYNLSFKTSRCRNGRRHSSALDACRTSHPYHRTDEWGASGRDEWRATPLLHFYRSKQRGRCRRVHYKAQRGGARNTAATKLAQASRRRGGTGVGRHLADRSRQSPRIEWHSIISSCYD